MALTALPEVVIPRNELPRVMRGQPVLLRGAGIPAAADPVHATYGGRSIAIGAIERGEFHPNGCSRASRQPEGARRIQPIWLVGAGKAFPLNYISASVIFVDISERFRHIPPAFAGRLRAAPARDSDPTVLDDIPAPAVPPAGSDPCRFYKQKGYPMSITAERKQALITEYATGAR